MSSKDDQDNGQLIWWCRDEPCEECALAFLRNPGKVVVCDLRLAPVPAPRTRRGGQAGDATFGYGDGR